jgi:predicted glutamine amidotransferase
MCLIATSTSGFEDLPRHFWHAAIAAFTDGMGVMYHDGEAVVTYHSLEYDTDKLFEVLLKVPTGKRVAVHLREATYGARCAENIHPHVLHLSARAVLAVMHNGSIPELLAHAQTGHSDTYELVQTWIRDHVTRNPALWNDPTFLAELATFVGPNNRLIMVDQAGAWNCIGRELGFHVGGTWLSNRKVEPWL